MEVNVFVGYHKKAPLIKSECFIPIHLGRSICKKDNQNYTWLIENMLGDDTGDNISKNNTSMSELTAQYWAWKNCDADYIGLYHYRRIFNIYSTKISEYSEKNWFKQINDEKIKDLCSRYDVILPKKHSVCPELSSVLHSFAGNKIFQTSDFYEFYNIIIHKYPEMANILNNTFNGEYYYPCNLFIMKKDIFDKYSEFVFDVLFEYEKNVDVTKYSGYSARITGCYAELMTYIFFNFYKDKYKILELPILKYEPLFNENKKITKLKKILIKLLSCLIPNKKYRKQFRNYLNNKFNIQ